MNVKDRIYLFVEAKGLSIKKFEELSSLSNGYVSSMRKSLGAEKLNNVLNAFPELNREWLLYGEGEMLKHSSNTATIGTNNGLVSVGNSNTNTYYNNASPAVTEEADEEVLPIIPRHLYEDTEVDVFEYVTENVVPTSPRIQQLPSYSMCYQVYSDELVPDIIPGDRLYIKPHTDVRKIIDGKPYVLETSTNGLMLRILYKGDTGLRASTKSQKYRDEYVPFEDIVRVYRILGLLRANI